MNSLPLVISEAPQIHAMMIASGVSSALVSKEQNKNLRGTLTDKINVENFCYNYQNYVLHSTVQFSEGQAARIRRPVERAKKSVANDAISVTPTGIQRQNSFLAPFNEKEKLRGVSRDRANTPSKNQKESSPKKIEDSGVFDKIHPPDIEVYFDPNNVQDRAQIREALRTKAIKRLEAFFERGLNEHCLLFLSGHGLGKATFVLNDSVQANLTLEEILKAWDIHKSPEWIAADRHGRPKVMRRHLLIVIDACNSGTFTSMIQKEFRRPLKDVSIQASSNVNEKSYDDALGGGGYFLNNLLYINGLKDLRYNYQYRAHDSDNKERRDWQRPTFYSQFPELEQMFRLRIGFNRWEELEWRVNTALTGTFIGDNGDILKGEFKSLQLHGPGEKRLANGRVETGTFRNDKLDGVGQVKWNNFECSGRFDRGRLNELYWARLSNGLELSMLDKENENAAKYSVVIQDDMIQEITKLNETDQCSSLFEWVVTRYANSDTNKSIYRNGIRHGSCFHLCKDGGVILSQYKNGVQHFTYSIDDSANVEITAIEFWDISKQEKKSESEGVPSRARNKKDNLMKIFKGKINRLFEERSAEFWRDMDLPDRNNLKLMIKGHFMYEGDVDKNRQPDGHGKFTDDQGNEYDGQWKNGLPDGKGSFKSRDKRTVYEGFWTKGLRHGIGKMIWEGGDVYSGTWCQDIVCGRGILKCANWVTYEGFMIQTRTGPFLKKIWPANQDVRDKFYCRPENLLYVFGTEQRGAFPLAFPTKESQLGLPALPNDRSLKPFDFTELNRESFYGEIKRGLRNGYGKISTPDSLIFEGEFFEDMLIVENQRAVLEDESRYEGSCLMRLVLDGNFTGARLVYKNRFVMEGPHMTGKMIRSDGSVYEGDFVTKVRHGKGKLTLKDGTVYEGGFAQNLFSDQGKYTTPDGQVYEGHFFEGMLTTHGHTHKFPNGDVYTGSCLMSPRNSRDKADRDTFDEFWVFREMHGRGILKKASGDVYEGKFYRNQQHGLGTLYIDGEKDEDGDYSKPQMGTFFHNYFYIKNSTVTFTLRDGEKYTGDFLARRLRPTDPKDQFVWEDEWYFHSMHGTGRLEESDGTIYEGEFEDSQKSDRGKLISPNQEVYEGMFACQWKDPYGKLTMANKDEYLGEFEFGEISGKGTYRLSTGDVYQGDCKGEKIRLFMEKVKCRDRTEYTGWCWTERIYDGQKITENVIKNHWKFVSRDGFGTLTRADGSTFTGHFMKNLKRGIGQFVYANGTAYRGSFSENKLDGLGKFIRQDGSYLFGTFKEGEFWTGTVSIIFADGQTFKSEWDRNDFEENALVVFPDGNVLKTQKNPEIRNWLKNLVKKFMDWPQVLIFPDNKKSSKNISKGISRAETLGMNLQFEHANSIGPAVSIPDRKMIKNYFERTAAVEKEEKKPQEKEIQIRGEIFTNSLRRIPSTMSLDAAAHDLDYLKTEIDKNEDESPIKKPNLASSQVKHPKSQTQNLKPSRFALAAPKSDNFENVQISADEGADTFSKKTTEEKEPKISEASSPQILEIKKIESSSQTHYEQIVKKQTEKFENVQPQVQPMSVIPKIENEVAIKPNYGSPSPKSDKNVSKLRFLIPKPEEFSNSKIKAQTLPDFSENSQPKNLNLQFPNPPSEQFHEKNPPPLFSQEFELEKLNSISHKSLPVQIAEHAVTFEKSPTCPSNTFTEPSNLLKKNESLPNLETNKNLSEFPQINIQPELNSEDSIRSDKSLPIANFDPWSNVKNMATPSSKQTDKKLSTFVIPKPGEIPKKIEQKKEIPEAPLAPIFKKKEETVQPFPQLVPGIVSKNYSEKIDVDDHFEKYQNNRQENVDQNPPSRQIDQPELHASQQQQKMLKNSNSLGALPKLAPSNRTSITLEQMIAKNKKLNDFDVESEQNKYKTSFQNDLDFNAPVPASFERNESFSGPIAEAKRRQSVNYMQNIHHARKPSEQVLSAPRNVILNSDFQETHKPSMKKQTQALVHADQSSPMIPKSSELKYEIKVTEPNEQPEKEEKPQTQNYDSQVPDYLQKNVTSKLKSLLKKSFQDMNETSKNTDTKNEIEAAKTSRSFEPTAKNESSGKLESENSHQGEQSILKNNSIRLENGAVYEGQIDNGKMQGIGILRYKNGSVYCGRFFNNRFHGSGKFTKASGSVLTGYFVPVEGVPTQYKVTISGKAPIIADISSTGDILIQK
jgi:hypothetical protein